MIEPSGDDGRKDSIVMLVFIAVSVLQCWGRVAQSAPSEEGTGGGSCLVFLERGEHALVGLDSLLQCLLVLDDHKVLVAISDGLSVLAGHE